MPEIQSSPGRCGMFRWSQNFDSTMSHAVNLLPLMVLDTHTHTLSLSLSLSLSYLSFSQSHTHTQSHIYTCVCMHTHTHTHTQTLINTHFSFLIHFCKDQPSVWGFGREGNDCVLMHACVCVCVCVFCRLC